jgi:hypothetical protein
MEMAQHATLRIDTGIQVFFADPHSTWQEREHERPLTTILPEGNRVDPLESSRPRRRRGHPQQSTSEGPRLEDTRRGPRTTPIDHFDKAVLRGPVESGQFGSWTFTDRAEASGLLPSMGNIADCFDNAMIESFWSRIQVELLDRRRWNTRIELANAMFEYLEIWHNRPAGTARWAGSHP